MFAILEYANDVRYAEFINEDDNRLVFKSRQEAEDWVEENDVDVYLIISDDDWYE